MKELVQKVSNLEKDVEKLKSLQDSGGSGGTVTAVTASSPLASSGGATPDISLNNSGVTGGTYSNPTFTVTAKGLISAASSGASPVTSVGATAPVTSTGGTNPNIGISITPANPGGAVALQAAYPGTQQTGNENLSGSINAGTTYYKGGVEWMGQGTTFPGSPATNQRYFRTDRGIEYFYDGTQWLSIQLFPLPLTFNPTGAVTSPLSATAPVALISGPPEDTYKLYVVKAIVRAVTNTTLDATNNWTFELFRQNSAAGSVSLGTVNTFQTGRTAGGSYLNTITVNTALSAVTDVYVFYIAATKNSSPGTLTFSPAVLWFRLIG